MKLETKSYMEDGMMIARDILITYDIHCDIEEDDQQDFSQIIRFYLTDDKESWIDEGGIQYGESNFLFIRDRTYGRNISHQKALDIIEDVKKTIGDNISERVIRYAEKNLNHKFDIQQEENGDDYFECCEIHADKCKWISDPFVVPCMKEIIYNLQINEDIIEGQEFNPVYHGSNAEKFSTPLTPKKDISAKE